MDKLEEYIHFISPREAEPHLFIVTAVQKEFLWFGGSEAPGRVAQGQPFIGLPIFLAEEIDLQLFPLSDKCTPKLRQTASWLLRELISTCQSDSLQPRKLKVWAGNSIACPPRHPGARLQSDHKTADITAGSRWPATVNPHFLNNVSLLDITNEALDHTIGNLPASYADAEKASPRRVRVVEKS